jgi:sec-independent protein translocase protein TatC
MARASNLLALNDPDPKEMSVVDHLTELRQRLIVCILTVALFSVVGWFLTETAFNLLVQPLLPYTHGHNPARLVFETLTSAFLVKIKISVAIGIAIGLPVLLYETWMFVAPAVSVHSRRYIVPFVLLGIVLFLVGISVGYFVFPRVVQFLIGQGNTLGPGAEFLLQIDQYVAQFALILAIFGAVFELPVILTFLSMIGLTSSRFLRSKRKYAGMLGLIGAMIITPGADPITPFITAAVIYVLYEFSIVLVRAIHR